MSVTVKAFAAGAALPALLMPFILMTFSCLGLASVSQHPYFHFIPLQWGIWNILYHHICKSFLPGDESMRMAATGAGLAAVIACGVMWFTNAPAAISALGLPWSLWVAIILGVYALIWATLVVRLNKLVGLTN